MKLRKYPIGQLKKLINVQRFALLQDYGHKVQHRNETGEVHLLIIDRRQQSTWFSSTDRQQLPLMQCSSTFPQVFEIVSEKLFWYLHFSQNKKNGYPQWHEAFAIINETIDQIGRKTLFFWSEHHTAELWIN